MDEEILTPLLLVRAGINDSVVTPNYLDFVGADTQISGTRRTSTCYLIIYSCRDRYITSTKFRQVLHPNRPFLWNPTSMYTSGMVLESDPRIVREARVNIHIYSGKSLFILSCVGSLRGIFFFPSEAVTQQSPKPSRCIISMDVA